MRRMGSRGNESKRKQVAAFNNETIAGREYMGVLFVDRALGDVLAENRSLR